MAVNSSKTSYTNSYMKSCREEDDAAVLALSVCSNMFPTALSAAVQLDLFEILAVAGDGVGISVSDIMSRLPATASGSAVVLDSILRLLVSHSLLTCSVNVLGNGDSTELRYAISPAGKFFVKDESGVSFSQYQAFVAGEIPKASALKDVVLQGGTICERMFGTCFYGMMMSDAAIRNKFGEAMRAHSTLLMRKVVKVYDGFKGLSSLVNVAGGSGSALDIVISEYPSIRGINFDMPQVVETAPPYRGVEHIGGDMFLQVPKGDAFLLKLVLHNWDDESCIKLLKKCYEALPDKGKVIVMDCILPNMPRADDVHSQYACQMDLLMSAMLGGKERAEDAFAVLATKAGFAEFKVVCYVYGLWIMEFIK